MTNNEKGRNPSSIGVPPRSILRAKGPSNGSVETMTILVRSIRTRTLAQKGGAEREREREKRKGKLTFDGSLFSKIAYMGISHSPGSFNCPLQPSVTTKQSFARPETTRGKVSTVCPLLERETKTSVFTIVERVRPILYRKGRKSQSTKSEVGAKGFKEKAIQS